MIVRYLYILNNAYKKFKTVGHSARHLLSDMYKSQTKIGVKKTARPIMKNHQHNINKMQIFVLIAIAFNSFVLDGLNSPYGR